MHLENKVLLFADNAVVYSIDSSYENAVSRLQKDLNVLALWTRDSLLTVNADKS